MSGAADADLILTGGLITTLDEERPEVAAIAIRGDRIIAIGDADEVASAKGAATRVIDLGGRRVVPGLIDGHVHMARAGLTWDVELRWEELDDLDAALATITDRAALTAPGTWIRAIGGWNEEQFRQGRGPTRSELDAAAPEHPVFVQSRYVSGQLNSRAIAVLGLDETTAAAAEQQSGIPVGSGFERDGSGAPTGRVHTMPLLSWVYRQLPTPGFDEQVASTASLSRDLARLGMTGVVDAGGLNMGPDAYGPLVETWRRGELVTRMRLFKHGAALGTEHVDIAGILRHEPQGFGDPLLRIAGIGEIILFRSHDGFGAPRDVSAAAADELRELLLACAAAGRTVHLHVQSAEFLQVVLRVWGEIAAEHPIDQMRWTILHGDAITADDIPAISSLGVAVGVQSLLRLAGAEAIALWGADRVASAPPLRNLLDAGIPVPLGSDATRVSSINPWLSLQFFVTGRTVDGTPTLREPHLLSRLDALRGYTRTAAWSTFEEHERGVLRVGALADLAVLTEDYFDVPSERIGRIRSDLTLLGGAIVWESDAWGSGDGPERGPY